MQQLLSIGIVVAAVLWIVLLITALFGKLILSLIPDQRKRMQGSQQEAEAVVLNIEKTGLYFDNKPQVKMQVQVIPEKGRNYIAEAISVLENNKIIEGSRVRVAFNPRHPQKIKFVAASI